MQVNLSVDRLRGNDAFYSDVEQLVEYVKSSALAPGSNGILIPGEPETLEETRRSKEGIAIDAETWRQISETATKYGVTVPQ